MSAATVQPSSLVQVDLPHTALHCTQAEVATLALRQHVHEARQARALGSGAAGANNLSRKATAAIQPTEETGSW
jgi:hypothetical protein